MSKKALHSWAFGVATKNSSGEIIEVFYPQPQLNPDPALGSRLLDVCNLESGSNDYFEITDQLQAQLIKALDLKDKKQQDSSELLQRLCASSQPVILCLLTNDTAPATVPEAFLKLHLALSQEP